VDHLSKPKGKKPTEKKISHTLKECGFDAATNSQKLTQKYLSLQ
jgi:hypothetical protein